MTAPENAPTPAPEELLRAAVAFARWGTLVVPLHSWENGACSCGRADCSSPGKHPRTRRGLLEATKDVEQVRRWWATWPTANVGIVTGAISGIVVLDVDPRHGGDESLAALEAEIGAAPTTPTARTGGGGRHLLFAHPGIGQKIGNRANFRPGLDVRGDGGYIVAPPSGHRSGGRYAWLSDGETPLAAPTWLLEGLRLADLARKKEREPAPPPPNVLPFSPPGSTAEARKNAYGRAALARILEVVRTTPEGGRNQSLNRQAFGAGRLVGAGVVARGEAERELLAAALASGLEAHEATATIRSGLNAGEGDPAETPDFSEDRRQKAPGASSGGAGPVARPGAPSSTRGAQATKEGQSEDDDEDTRPWIQVNGRQISALVAAAWGAILAANDPTPAIFRREGMLIRLVPHDRGGLPRLETVSAQWLLGYLGQVARWRKVSASGPVDSLPPKELPGVLIAAPSPLLPVLDQIVGAPTFDADGTLVSVPGYHPAARLWYHRPAGLELPEVPQIPTAEQVAAAKTLLLDELLGEFPFCSDADRAHALAGILLPFLRRVVKGPTPLHLVEAPTPGSGKTYLTMIANALLEGGAGSSLRVGRDDEETTKILFAKLLRAPAVVRLDNLAGGIDSPVLAEILTSEEWEARILGSSSTVSLPIRTVFWATSNNPKLSTEVARRTARVRLNPKMERPERKVFRKADLLGWADDHRGEILGALFVLVRSWLAAGRPAGSTTVGTYGAWAAVVGGVLENAGITGLLGNQDELFELADEESSAWGAFVSAWSERYADRWVGVFDLWRLADPPADDGGDKKEGFLGDKLSSRSDRGRQTQMGTILRGIRDRVFSGRVVVGRLNLGTKKWEYRLEQAEGAAVVEPGQGALAFEPEEPDDGTIPF